MKRAVPNKVDRDKLHGYLFRNANSRGKITVKHFELAEDLGIRSDHFGRIMAEMVAAERMQKIATGPTGVTYVVKDPDVWKKSLPQRKMVTR